MALQHIHNACVGYKSGTLHIIPMSYHQLTRSLITLLINWMTSARIETTQILSVQITHTYSAIWTDTEACDWFTQNTFNTTKTYMQ